MTEPDGIGSEPLDCGELIYEDLPMFSQGFLCHECGKFLGEVTIKAVPNDVETIIDGIHFKHKRCKK